MKDFLLHIYLKNLREVGKKKKPYVGKSVIHPKEKFSLITLSRQIPALTDH